MAGPSPDGEPAPADGGLPAAAVAATRGRDFGVYIHVPFCRVRCGYCDFNTYTAPELRGVRRSDYAAQAEGEVAFAGRALRGSGIARRRVATVFVGGGTPTLLPPDDLARMLRAVRDQWGLVDGAEVTVEANPDSVTRDDIFALAAAGVTRMSFGMQSAVPRVLAVLERTHHPDNIPLVVEWARAAGLDVSLDLIYGTPGETMDEWRTSVEAALACEPDHLSAYALIVERGTSMERRIRRGELPAPDDDLEADEYEWTDDRLRRAGFAWYELSNWARPGHASRHNLAYWTGQDWWGIGPGAHSHVGNVRWWNVRHPAVYAQRIAAGVSPAVAREVLDESTAYEERVLLETRLRRGMPLADLRVPVTEFERLAADGLILQEGLDEGRLVLSLRGRLVADAIVRDLLETGVSDGDVAAPQRRTAGERG